jgi:TldD protein
MIDLIQQRGLDFGIVIRKLDLPSSAPIDEARRLISGGGSSGAAQPISIPLYVFKVFPDGHEQMIRGVRLRGINARTLKDILMAGDDSVTFNYLDNGAPYALLASSGNSSEVSIVSPSLLIDDLELAKMDEELPKLPIAPSPLSSGQ